MILYCFAIKQREGILGLGSSLGLGFEQGDVQEICQYISNLCKEQGCSEPSELCAKAAAAIGTGDEEKYLDLCAQSCVKCGEAKRPQRPKNDAYVA